MHNPAYYDVGCYCVWYVLVFAQASLYMHAAQDVRFVDIYGHVPTA